MNASHHETCGVCHAALCEHAVAKVVTEGLRPSTDLLEAEAALALADRALDGARRRAHEDHLASQKSVGAALDAFREATERLDALKRAAVPPVDRAARDVVGAAVAPGVPDTTPKENGQQRGYVVLSDAERARGFVRPVRERYTHVGARPRGPTRPLTAEEQGRYPEDVAYEAYAVPRGSVVGRYWTAAQLKGGCGTVTTMSRPIAETWARDNGFYGRTFCIGCGTHFPVAEFVWFGTDEVLGT